LVYKINILPGAQKQILSLPRTDQIKVVRLIDGLAENPRPNGCKKLKGTEFWRIRSGHLRIIYSIVAKELRILILKVGKRQEDTYKDLS
jgi:mRNA interferase RelE/StbE